MSMEGGRLETSVVCLNRQKRGRLVAASPITEDVRIRQEKKPVVAMTQEEAYRTISGL